MTQSNGKRDLIGWMSRRNQYRQIVNRKKEVKADQVTNNPVADACKDVSEIWDWISWYGNQAQDVFVDIYIVSLEFKKLGVKRKIV